MKVKIKKLNESAVIPKYSHVNGDMGMDVTAISYEYDAKYDRFIYHTGLAFELPEGHGMFITPRSSNTKTEAYIPNSPGILDCSYRGELLVIYKLTTPFDQLFPTGDINLNRIEMENEMAPYKVGDRIAQIVILPYPTIEFEEVEELSDTDRGADGGLVRDNKNFK